MSVTPTKEYDTQTLLPALVAAYHDAAKWYGFQPTPHWLECLREPPLAVMGWTMEQAAGRPDLTGEQWVKDVAMAIYALEHGLAVEPDRKSITKRQARSADKRAAYAVSDRIWQKGRRGEADVPLLLYLIFTVEILIGKPFRLSRPNSDLNPNLDGSTPPGGPAFRLVQAAYCLASVRQHVMPSGPETIFEVARIARTPRFKEYLAALWHPWANPDMSLPDIVALQPGSCTYAYAEASRRRRRERT